MKKQKVLQVLFSGLGGHGSVFFSLIEGDVNKEVQHAALFFGTENTKQEYIDFCQQNNVKHTSIIKKTGIDIASWKQVFNAFRAEMPAVILLHSLNLLRVALAYSSIANCRLIVVEHTPLETKTKAEWASSVVAMLLAPKIVLLTPNYARGLEKKFGSFLYRKNKTWIINNGVNISKYSPATTSKNYSGEIIISMIARFSATKDQETLVRAFDRLKQLISAPVAIKLHLAGSGETLESVKSLAKSLNLEKEIFFTGTLDEGAIIPFLQNTDVYVHSSKSETMSTSVLQAMAIGLPVIGSDINGVNNLLIPEENGMLFEQGNAEILVEKITELLTNQDKAKKLGEAARQYAVQNYSHKVMFRRYYELFNAD